MNKHAFKMLVTRLRGLHVSQHLLLDLELLALLLHSCMTLWAVRACCNLHSASSFSCFSFSRAARTLTLKLSGGSPTTTAHTRRNWHPNC